jgi:tRNA(Ile2) C34 agmatinyltransferase TiaS
MNDVEKDDELVHATKRCPECFTYVELDTKKCPKCKTSLGEVQKHGMAKRKVDWKAYAIFLAAFLAFAAYIWWAFL